MEGDSFFDLFLGYSAIWVLLALFVVRLMVDQRRIAKELTKLRSESGAK